MNKNSTLKIFIILFLVFIMLIANTNTSKQNTKTFSINKLLSNNLEGWEGQDLNPDKQVFKLISPNEMLIKQYKKGNNQKINLAIVVSNNVIHIHDPEVCYRLQGFVFKKKTTIHISPKIKGNYILAEKNNKQYCFIYWYSDLNQSFNTRFQFMKSIIWSKFINKPIKGYSIFIFYCPRKDFKELIKFSSTVNKVLLPEIK